MRLSIWNHNWKYHFSYLRIWFGISKTVCSIYRVLNLRNFVLWISITENMMFVAIQLLCWKTSPHNYCKHGLNYGMRLSIWNHNWKCNFSYLKIWFGISKTVGSISRVLNLRGHDSIWNHNWTYNFSYLRFWFGISKSHFRPNDPKNLANFVRILVSILFRHPAKNHERPVIFKFRWLGYDRGAIRHRIPKVSSKAVTGNTQKHIFHDLCISWKVTSAPATPRI